jgi:uncharacterized protein (TIGR03437 family)
MSSIPARASNSVFVEGAFNGTWVATFPVVSEFSGTITFTQVSDNFGITMLNSLGDPNFVSNNCPDATEKREFYQATYTYAGGGDAYACTNGAMLFGRFHDSYGPFNQQTGSFEIYQTNPRNTPSWSGNYSYDSGGPSYTWSGMYDSGGIATPLAQVGPDELSITSVDPTKGTLLVGGALQDFTAVIHAKVNTHLVEYARILVVTPQNQVIGMSAETEVDLNASTTAYTLKISQAQIPDNLDSIYLRASMRLPDGTVVLSTPQIKYSVNLGPTMLSVAPPQLRFVSSISNPGTLTQTLVVQKSGSGSAVTFQASVLTDSPWITSVSPSSGQANNTQPGLVTVTVDSHGLDLGSYVGTIQVVSTTGTIKVPVTLVIDPAGPLLSLDVTGLRFEVRQGQGSSITQDLTVSNLGDANSVVNWSAKVIDGAGLLALTPALGTSTADMASNLEVQLTGSATDVVGPGFAVIEVSDPQAQNSPQYVTVVVDVSGSSSPTIPLPSPAGLFFTAVQGGPQPPSQTVTMNVSNNSVKSFGATSVTASGGQWLSVSPSGGSASTSQPVQVDAIASTAGLLPGVYRGTMNFSIGPTVRGVNVTLVVQPSASAANSLAGRSTAKLRTAAGCAPTRVVLSETSLVSSFSVPAGYPAVLTAQAFDDCGTPLTNASVVASFSNGDAPVSLRGDQQNNNYSATWQPGTAAPQTAVTLVGTSGALTPDTLEIRGTVNPNATPPPMLTPSGILNNLNPVVGGAVAPGTVAQLFGQNMAAMLQSAPSVPLPTRLQGVQVVIGGFNAPLFYVSPTQLNIQVPSELEPNRTYPALLAVNNAFSLPEPLDLVPLDPGTVASTDGTLVAQHSDYSLVTQDNPAKPGESLIMYLVGMGATDQTVPSGTAAPGDPLANASVQPQITIDGQNAQIIFAGLTPGGVGLYQINFVVPPNVPTGNLDVVITQGGVTANQTKLVVGQ